MATAKNGLKDRLERYREIELTVVGRESGKKSSRPVWFVLEGDKVYLLPVAGSETQWFKNVRKNPQIQVKARDAEESFRVKTINEPKAVASVVEKFRGKYGAGDVKKYYSNLDVAVAFNVK